MYLFLMRVIFGVESILIQDLTDYEQIANELEVTKKLERTLQTVLDTTYDGHIVID